MQPLSRLDPREERSCSHCKHLLSPTFVTLRKHLRRKENCSLKSYTCRQWHSSLYKGSIVWSLAWQPISAIPALRRLWQENSRGASLSFQTLFPKTERRGYYPVFISIIHSKCCGLYCNSWFLAGKRLQSDSGYQAFIPSHVPIIFS